MLCSHGFGCAPSNKVQREESGVVMASTVGVLFGAGLAEVEGDGEEATKRRELNMIT